MNIYDLHTNPEQLYGFYTAPYKIPKLAYKLAKENPELRPRLEPVIMKDAQYTFFYAKEVLERRWPEAEPVIMKDPMWALNYAFHVLKRPWPEAEPYIMKYSYYAFYYATAVLKIRWPEAEPYIMKDAGWWKDYKRYFRL